jgi:hypothetical protein
MRCHAVIAACLAVAALAFPALADPSGQPRAADRTPTQAASALLQMQTSARHARLVLMWARELGTRPQVACADEGLSRADVALRTARDHARALEDAMTRRDAATARRELGWIDACEEAAKAASRASDACFDVGEATVVRVVAAPAAGGSR